MKPIADFCLSLSAAWRKCQTVWHALRCGLQSSDNNWAKKKTHTWKKRGKTQCGGGTSIKASLPTLSNESRPPPPQTKGLFSSFKMTHIFTPCPPSSSPFPLPWPVPKGSSAHGGQVSCRPLKKHASDVQGLKTMLNSSKQTLRLQRLHKHTHTHLIQATDRTTGLLFSLCWGQLQMPSLAGLELTVGAEHRKTELNID